MKFDIEGRMRNLRLPDGKTALLYSVYEAVTNGIQAIEERFRNNLDNKQGAISVKIVNTTDKTVESIVVCDNGIGLNQRHLDSFNVCDTTEKADIGGRGVGRLVWLKAFSKVEVQSAYTNDVGVAEGVTFEFCPELADSREGLKKVPEAFPRRRNEKSKLLRSSGPFTARGHESYCRVHAGGRCTVDALP
jgi:hypothetical protein